MLDWIKHYIDLASTPSISFTVFSVVFIWALFQRWVWTKQGTIVAMVVITITLYVALLDHNFRVTLLKPDNAPIFLMIYIFGLCLWVAMTQAHNNDRRMEQKLPPEEKETSDQKTWVWPDLVYIEFLCMILCTVFLVVWSLAVRAPLEEPANPSNTPNPSKAPWYFLGLQELLVYFDPWYAGVVLPSIIVIGLMAIPYIDVNPKGSGYYCFKERKLAILTFLIGFFILWDFLIPIGTILRGPGWNFFGPFEEWNAHKVVALTNVNLSEYVWVKWFYPMGIGNGLPATNNSFFFYSDAAGMHFDKAGLKNIGVVCVKEFLGIIFLAWWYLYLPGRLARGTLGCWYERVGVKDILAIAIIVLALFFTFGKLPALLIVALVIILLCIWFLYLSKQVPSNLSRLNIINYNIGDLLNGTKGLYESLKFGRYAVAIFLFLTMALVPMKMYGRWLFNLKYILDTPWLKF